MSFLIRGDGRLGPVSFPYLLDVSKGHVGLANLGFCRHVQDSVAFTNTTALFFASRHCCRADVIIEVGVL